MQGKRWDAERDDKLRALWGTGPSAADIASTIGGVTRNAVIGRAHRLGLVLSHGSRSAAAKAGAAAMKRIREARWQRDNARWQRDNARRERDNARRHKEPIGQKAIVGELFRKVHLPSEPVSFAEDLVPTVRNLLDLEAHHCRWIPGEVRGGFCGRNVVNGLVYCEFHAKRAYVPAKVAMPYASARHAGGAKADNIKLLDVAEFVGA
jgi:GcrA cell cycle regulator